MASLTKTQINYFKDRIQSLLNTCQWNLSERLPFEDNLTREEKLGLILSGKVQVRDDLNVDSCSRFYFLDAYYFPTDDAVKTRNAAIAARRGQVMVRLKAQAERLTDQFVLGRVTPEEAIEKMEKKFEELVA